MRKARIVIGVAIALASVVYLACGDDDSVGPTPDAGGDSGVITNPSDSGPPADSGPPDAGADSGAIGRGPGSLDFDPSGNGDPEALYWDDAKQKLFIADNRNNQLWSWTDTAGFVKLVKVKDDPVADDAGRTDLGSIVELPDGTLVVPRFGFGTVGNIEYVDPTTGDAGTVPGVDQTLKRTALAYQDGGQLWGGTFIAPGDGNGTVTQIDRAAGETTYATGFEKPVGVLVYENNLLVADQIKNGGEIYLLPLDGGFPAGGPYTVFADVPQTDVLTRGPSDTLFTGQFKPLSDGGPLQIRQIFPDGGYTTFPTTTLTKPKGTAYDPTKKRLFVADSNGTLIRTIKVFPVN